MTRLHVPQGSLFTYVLISNPAGLLPRWLQCLAQRSDIMYMSPAHSGGRTTTESPSQAAQDILDFSWYPKFHYCVHKNLHKQRILSYFNLINILITTSIKNLLVLSF